MCEHNSLVCADVLSLSAQVPTMSGLDSANNLSLALIT